MPKPLVMYFLGHSLLHHFSRMFLLCLLNRLLSAAVSCNTFFTFLLSYFISAFTSQHQNFFLRFRCAKRFFSISMVIVSTTILSKVYFLPRLSSPYRQRIHLHIVFCQRKKLDCSIVVFPLLLSYMYNARHSESFQSKKVQKKCFVAF